MAEGSCIKCKGNEAIRHAAIRCGADGYFGYPITPQSEVLETLAELKPWETTGMVVLQAESEVAAINMVYGGAGRRKEGNDLLFKSGCELETRRNLLFGRCRTSLSDCECNAWRSRTGNYPT